MTEPRICAITPNTSAESASNRPTRACAAPTRCHSDCQLCHLECAARRRPVRHGRLRPRAAADRRKVHCFDRLPFCLRYRLPRSGLSRPAPHGRTASLQSAAASNGGSSSGMRSIALVLPPLVKACGLDGLNATGDYSPQEVSPCVHMLCVRISQP